MEWDRIKDGMEWKNEIFYWIKDPWMEQGWNGVEWISDGMDQGWIEIDGWSVTK